MRWMLLITLSLSTAAAGQQRVDNPAATPTPARQRSADRADDFYQVEYRRPADGVGLLQVIFYVPVNAKAAESVLRRELAIALDVAKPQQDVLITAFDGQGKEAGQEDPVKLADGSEHLIYLAAAHRIVTYQQYSKQKHSPGKLEEASQSRTRDVEGGNSALRHRELAKGMTVAEADRAMKYPESFRVDRAESTKPDGRKAIDWEIYIQYIAPAPSGGWVHMRSVEAIFDAQGRIVDFTDTTFKLPGQ